MAAVRFVYHPFSSSCSSCSVLQNYLILQAGSRRVLQLSSGLNTELLNTSRRRWVGNHVIGPKRVPSFQMGIVVEPRSGIYMKEGVFNPLQLLKGHVRLLTNRSNPMGRRNVEKSLQPKPTLKTRILSLTPHENIYTVPNILTFSRLLAAPLIGYLVLHDYHSWAFALFAYAGITDLIDGWIARKWKLQTVVGTVIDPMADKTLMTVLTGCLAWTGAMPAYLAAIILGRDFLLGLSALYYRYISLPPPKTFTRYWDFSLPSAEVHPTGISKINTALQLGLIGWTVSLPLLTGYSMGGWLESGLVGMQYLVATTTLWSGASYLYTKDAVKILTQGEREDRVEAAKAKQKTDI